LLEIGCGVGLLMERLAPSCERYCGVDIAESAVKRLRAWLAERRDLSHVEILHSAASHLEGSVVEAYDTVVLNSVVQYFPSVEYFVAVLRSLVSRLPA